MSSILSSHVNSDVVTRGELAALPVPTNGTDSFRPVPHIELVDVIGATLERRGYSIEREQFALRRDAAMIFGTFDVNSGINDGRFSLGFRAANDKTLAIQICAGLNIFVCDNMCFRGELIALVRKHTSGLNLIDEVSAGIVRWEEHAHLLTDRVDELKARQLVDADAKGMLFDLFVEQQIAPLRLLPAVFAEYREPRHEEFAPRTAWSLHNAFTEIAKQMPVTTRIPAIQAVGRYFGI